jgi:hypothetical protein
VAATVSYDAKRCNQREVKRYTRISLSYRTTYKRKSTILTTDEVLRLDSFVLLDPFPRDLIHMMVNRWATHFRDVCPSLLESYLCFGDKIDSIQRPLASHHTSKRGSRETARDIQGSRQAVYWLPIQAACTTSLVDTKLHFTLQQEKPKSIAKAQNQLIIKSNQIKSITDHHHAGCSRFQKQHPIKGSVVDDCDDNNNDDDDNRHFQVQTSPLAREQSLPRCS